MRQWRAYLRASGKVQPLGITPSHSSPAPGGAFFDPEADAALFDALQNDLRVTSDRRVLRFPLHINDPAFSDAIVESFVEVARS